jgi:hypothetical protein
MAKKEEKTEDCCTCGCHGKNSFTSIPAALAGIFLVLSILFMIFARSDIELLVPIIWAFVALGFFALLFNYLSLKHKN